MPGTIQSIERAAAVLHLLGAVGEPVPLGELARTLDLPKPTVHGITRTLVDVGFVVQDPETGHYALGHGLRDLGARLDPHLLRARAVNWADGLAARTGLEVQLGVLSGTTVELVHHVYRPDGSPQRLRTGEIQPLHASALGQVLLAFSPPAPGCATWSCPPTRPRPSPAAWSSPASCRRSAGRAGRTADGALRPGVAAVAARSATTSASGRCARRGRAARAVIGPDGAPRAGLPEQVTAAAEAIAATLQERL